MDRIIGSIGPGMEADLIGVEGVSPRRLPEGEGYLPILTPSFRSLS